MSDSINALNSDSTVLTTEKPALPEGIDQALESRKKIEALTKGHLYPRLMSADEQIYWQDASRAHGRSGSAGISLEDGSCVYGVLYSFDGKDYLQTKEGIYDYGFGDHFFISDPLVKESIEKLEAESRKIEQARDWIAKEYSEGDPILEEILRMHLDFTSGEIQPFIHEGIPFFQVGRNASHSFYTGTKDGKRYRLSCGDDYDEEDNPVYHVSEAKDDTWGYLGHL